MNESAKHVRVIEETPVYWRVLFENSPCNMVDATIFEGLQDLLARMDASPSLRVVSQFEIWNSQTQEVASKTETLRDRGTPI